MNKFKYFTNPLFAIFVAVIFSSAAYAQNGNRNHNKGGGQGNGERHYMQAPNNVSANNRGYSNQPNYHPVYRPNYYSAYHPVYHAKYYPVYHPSYHPPYGPGYRYYPSYYYHPIYRSPYVYPHFGPAFGIRLSILPFGYFPFFIGNNPFYYYQGIYYRPYSSGGYEVTAPPLGAAVTQLPAGAKVTVINGQKYYELGGTFYQEEITENNKLSFMVVGTDGVINTIDQNQVQPDNIPVPNNSPGSSNEAMIN